MTQDSRPESADVPPAAPDRLVDAVQRLSLARDLPAVLDVLRETLRPLTGAAGAACLLRDGGTSYDVAPDAIPPQWAGRRLPLDELVGGWVMRHGQAVAIADVADDPRLPDDARGLDFVRSVLMVPICRDEPVGALALYWAEPHVPDDDDTRRLQTIARSTAIALDHAERYAELERRVRERTDLAERESAERRRAEASLAESRRHFTSLVESAMDAIISIDAEQRIVFFNAAAESMFRYRAAEVIGRRVECLVPERFRVDHGGLVSAFLAHGTTSRRANELQRLCGLRADGEEFPIEAAFSKVDGGAGPRASVIVRDITRRVATAAALAASEARMRYVTEAAEVGYWDWDIEGDTLVWSPRCKRIFGLAEDDAVDYARFLGALHPEDRDRVDDAVRAALAGLGDFDIELRTVHPDDRICWVHSKGSTSFGSNGEPQRMGGIALDITARKAMEAALRDSEARFRSMADTAPAMLWMSDAEGVCTFLSRGWYEFTGQDERSGLGSGWLDAVHPEDRSGLADRYYASNARQQSFDTEYRVRRADGFYRWVLDAGRARFDDDGRFLGFIGSVIDITDRRSAEELVRRNALHDPLTKLPNRRLTLEFGEQLVAGGRRGNGRTAVMFIDLDNFKPINDRHGHHIGDIVLAEVARRLRSCVREEDVVGRLGGDEFVAVLSHIRHPDEAAQVARHILERLGAPYFVRLPDTGAQLALQTTPSIGISVFPDDGADMETLIGHADAAMYRAKAAGRGTYRFHAGGEPPR